MIPVLYEQGERAFATNGIGRLVDATECVVTEERNGIYELYMEYPIDGRHFSELRHSRIIYAAPADGKSPQPFRIYRIEKPLDGICSIYAEHISYQLNHIPAMPFSAGSAAAALSGLLSNAIQDCPFEAWTDKETTGTYTLKHPAPIREQLGGVQGSILDVYGKGDYEFDGYTVRLWTSRGFDRGVTIRYGKNLTDLEQDENIESTITGVCPYWANEEEGSVVTLPEGAVWAETASAYPYKRTAVIDFTSDFQEAPTEAQLRQRAQKYITDNSIGIPSVSLKVEFVPLRKADGVSTGTPERTLVLPARVEGDTVEDVNGTIVGSGAGYAILMDSTGAQVYDSTGAAIMVPMADTVELADASWEVSYQAYRALERINLCDTVTVVYSKLGVSVKARVIKTEYNVLKDRYDSIEIGDSRASLADTINDISSTVEETVDSQASSLRSYVDRQTQLINGGLGGYVVTATNANGQPEEILIMDAPDKANAVNVIRINKNGIGFSTSGYAGPFVSAWTIDGHFNADFITAGSINASLITTGTLLANLIKTGRIESKNGRVYFDLDNNQLVCSVLTAPRPWDSITGIDPMDVVIDISKRDVSRGNWASFASIHKTENEDNGLCIMPPRAGRGNSYAPSDKVIIFTSGETPIAIRQHAGAYGSGSTSDVLLEDYAAWISVSDQDGSSGLYGIYAEGRSGYSKGVQVSGTLYGHTIEAINLTVTGKKNRVVTTDDYGDRLLYCYEMPSPMFGDIGDGTLDDSGEAIISIDDVFAETARTDLGYQVFLQPCGEGSCYVADRQMSYFVVKGTPGLEFCWEIKARQTGFEAERLEERDAPPQSEYDLENLYKNELSDYLDEMEAVLYETA